MKNNIQSLEQFLKKSRAVRFVDKIQHTGSFSHTRQFGIRYYVYLCLNKLEVINPFAKKHSQREYKSFFSSISANEAKKMAYEYIMKNQIYPYSSYVKGVDFIPELVVTRCYTCGDIYKVEENKEHTFLNRKSFCSLSCEDAYKEGCDLN